MAGIFDDLPDASAQSGGLFDDLPDAPEQAQSQSKTGGMFDDAPAAQPTAQAEPVPAEPQALFGSEPDAEQQAAAFGVKPGDSNDRIDYLAHSAVSGVKSIVGNAAGILATAYNQLFGLSDSELNVLSGPDGDGSFTKADADKLRKVAPGLLLERAAGKINKSASDEMGKASPGAQQTYGSLEYATLDPHKSAFLSPTRLVGDIIQNLPNTLALAVVSRFGGSAANQAYGDAIAAGATEELAREAAIQAAASVITKAGAVGEGVLGYEQQAEQTKQQVMGLAQDKLDKSPEYQDLIKRGYQPGPARQIVADRAAAVGGFVAGLVDAVTNLASGPVLGKIIGEGGRLLPRIAKGVATEAAQETVQSAGEQLGGNVAVQQHADPSQSAWDGVLENALQGGAMGGLTGGAFAGAFGEGPRRETGAAPPAGAKPVPGVVEAAAATTPMVTPEDTASPLPTGDIAAGKKIMADAMAGQKAGEILGRNGWPGLGERVTVDHGNGQVFSGTVGDAFASSVPELGAAGEGIRINLDNGRSFEAFADEIRRAGVTIAPEALAPVQGVDAVAAPGMGGLLEQPAGTPASGLPGASDASLTSPGLLDGSTETPILPAAAPAPVAVGDGTQASPVQVAHPDHIDLAAAQVNTAPTDGQKEAGNYAKGHLRLHGLDITLENPKGSERSGVGSDGEPWSVQMPAHYGYIKRTVGADDEQVDVYVGPNPESTRVFVVDQRDADTGGFDEHKVMLGFPSEAAAMQAYRAAFSDGKGLDRMGGFHDMSLDEFKASLAAGKWDKPLAQGFTTNPAKIAAEHEAEVSSQEAAGTKDAAPRVRKFPSYTTEELRKAAADTARNDPEQIARLKEEIAARESGLSKPKVTPQIGPVRVSAPVADTSSQPKKGGQTQIGYNPRQHPLYEDDRGVRSYVESGIRISEPVGIVPGHGITIDKAARGRDFSTIEEWAQAKAEQEKARKGGEIAKAAEGIASGDKGTASDDVSAKSKADIDQAAIKALRREYPNVRDPFVNQYGHREGPRDALNFLRGWDMAKAGRPRSDATEQGEPVIRTGYDAFERAAPAKAPEKPATYGKNNTIFTQEERAAAAARIRNRLKNQLNSGIDPDMLADGIKVAGYHIEAGARAFTDYAKAMIEELGEAVRPYLKSWYSAIYDWPGIDGEGMTDPSRITPAMIASAGKEASDGISSPVPGGDEGAGAADVQRAGALGEDGRAPSRKNSAGASDVSGTDGEGAEAAERSGEQPVGGERGGTSSARNDDRLSEAGGGTGDEGRRRGQHSGKPDASVKGENYSIAPGGLQEGRSFRVKARDNIAAIKLVRQIEGEARPATKSEQDRLALYVGWGGIKGAFPDGDGKFSKGFEEIGAELKTLLTPAEYKTAQRSIQYAHYTSETIVRSMWDAVSRMGFAGGQVFEPGMGVGNFAGLMPPDIAAVTKYSGLELDHTTARIAKLLYPGWGVRQDDFTKAPLPKDTYDLVIGNPPFADITIKTDPAYAKHGFLLHDYFFAKSLDAVRPGGLLAFITSAGTMNKLDISAREYLAERAELVGAVRLPGDAFKENAGTQVTTDIIFLRKLLPGETAADSSWTETGEATLPNKEGGTKTGAVSSYFLANPDRVLGEQGFFDKLLPGRYGVRADGREFEPALKAALNTLTPNVMKPWATPEQRADADFATGQKKEGSFYLKDGAVMQMRGGVGGPVAKRGAGVERGKTIPEIQRIKGLIPIRDALRAVYEADLHEDGAAAAKARADLNKAYDAFVEKYGPINKADLQHRRPTIIQQESARAEAREESRFNMAPFDDGEFNPEPLLRKGAKLAEIARARQAARDAAAQAGRTFDEGTFNPADMPDIVIDRRPNVGPFMDDPESYRLRSIEAYDEETGKAEKRRVFFENVISKDRPPEIKNVGDALFYVLNRRGRLDIAEIAHAAGLSEPEAIEKLGDQIFLKPGTNAVWETSEHYLSGNVRQKLRDAQAAADTNPAFARNVEALKAVQPAPLPPSAIRASLGMPWIPTDVVRDFAVAEDGLGLERAKVSYVPALAQWSVQGDSNSAASTSTWGTSDRSADKLLLDALNRQDPKIYQTIYENGQKRQVLDPAATQAAQDKVRDIKAKFEAWVYSDDARTDRLVDLYNENYNSIVVPSYSGAHLTTPGIAAGWKWRPHQTRVIARIIQAGNTYMAHAVGAGKTSAMIASGMELRRLGLARKPMYAVPNHMLAQFAKEFYEQYPTARIMVADENRFHTDTRKQFIADVANEDLDAVIITHSAFGMIPVSPEFQDGLINEQIDQLRDLLNEMGKDQETRITRSKVENAIERLEQRLGGKSKRTDQTFTFEEMGIDHLFVDEAHLFRKLDFATKMGQVKGISPEGSKASWDLYVKTRWLETKNPGHSLVLASGTPITNTMAELYTVSRYIQPSELEARSLSHFDAWASAFGDTATDLEQNAAGGYKPVTRFAKFVNIPELSAMVRQSMDVVTSKQLEQYVTRPKIEGGRRQLLVVEKSERLEAYQQNLARRMKLIEQRKGPPKKGDDIMLTVINDGRHAAIDLRLAEEGLRQDPGSKLNLLVGELFKEWEATKNQPFHRPLPAGAGYEATPFMHGPATQMVFANLGIGEGRAFNVHKYIVSEMMRRGVPRDQIAVISDYDSSTARQRLFNDMNDGKVRILLGSTAKMATGVNAQRRLSAIHNLDPLWYPADDEQRIGRGLRQGNLNPELKIRDYSTKGTYDSTMWGMMERKAKFIQAFFEGDPSVRETEDLGEASQYEQAKAITTNDPRLITLTEDKQELEKERRRKDAFEREQYAIRDRLRSAEEDAKTGAQRVAAIEKDIAQAQDTSGDNFKAELGGTSYDERVKFGEAMQARLKELEETNIDQKNVKIGRLGGFQILASVKSYNYGGKLTWFVEAVLARNGGTSSSITTDGTPLGMVRSTEGIIARMPSEVLAYQHKIAKAEQDISEFTPKLGAKFDTSKIGDLTAKVLAMERQFAAEAAAAQTQMAAAAGPEDGEAPGLGETEKTFAGAADQIGPRGEEGKETDLTAEVAQFLTASGSDGDAVQKSNGIVEYLLARGERFGSETLVIFDLNGGDVIDANSVNAPDRVTFSLKTTAAMSQRDNALVAHHNHPKSRPLSSVDMRALGHAGMKWVIAYGHDGSFDAASLSPATSRAMAGAATDAQGAPADWGGRYQWALRKAGDAAYDMGADLIRSGRLPIDAANAFHGQLIMAAMERAGLVDYLTSRAAPVQYGDALNAMMDAATQAAIRYADGVGLAREGGRDGNSDRYAAPVERAEGIARVLGQSQGSAGIGPGRRGGEAGSDARPGTASGGAANEGLRQEGGSDRPLTARQFQSQYVQHIDLRGRNGTAAANRESILRDGFRQGANVNATPPSRAGDTGQYAPRLGDVVYLAPRGAWRDAPNGPEVQTGWKPAPHEVITITDPSRSMYENYLEAWNATHPRDELRENKREYAPLGPDRSVPPVGFANTQSEQRFQEARRGIGPGPGLVAQTKEWLTNLSNGFTRHYKALPNTREFSDVHQQLRKLEAAPASATGEIIRSLEKMVGDFNPAELDLFTRKVVLDDLNWETKQDHDLPFGLADTDVAAELAKVDAALVKRPDILDRVRQRKLAANEIADRMVKAGVLTAEQVKNPAYYRHQVLDYARAVVKQGTEGKLQKPRWAKRMGSTKDINANMLEAEFDWLHKALVDIETAKTIKWIKSSDHNIRDEVVSAARANNKTIYAKLLADDLTNNGYTLPTGRVSSPLNEADMEFRRSIAMGLGEVRAAIDNGYLDPIPQEFEDAARALSAQNMDENVFPFLAWIMDNDKDGARGAAGAFKGISGRRQFMRDLLGDRYADTSDMDGLLKKGFGRDGYVTWQPEDGKLLYTAKTLPEHVIDGTLRRMSQASDAEVAALMGLQGPAQAKDFLVKFADSIRGAAKDALVMGGEKYQLVIPEELAATLNSLRSIPDGFFSSRAFTTPMRMWKQWTLINPRRVLKYNLNNASGDLDAVIAGNPRILRQLPQAISELHAVMKGGVPSDAYREAVARGVFDSGITVQEIPDINQLKQFEGLFNRADQGVGRRFVLTPMGRVWRALKDYTQFRENWLRYAAYLHYRARLEAGETAQKIGYGASVPDLVEGIKDKKDQAAMLARDLVGDYGSVSVAGRALRQSIIPFYSWMEINTKRYIRLTANAYRQGIGAGLAKSGAVGAVVGARTTAYLGMRAFAIYGLISLFNFLFHDDDEDKLDPMQRSQLHLTLGHIGGQVVTLRMQGALSDFLSWFGFQDAGGVLSEMNKGRAGFSDLLAAIAKAPVNKVVGGITPEISEPVTLLAGVKLWPDAFNPTVVRDRWREVFQTISLENEYDAFAKRPSRGYAQSWLNAGVYTADPGEQAYNRIVSLAHDWEAQHKGTSGSSSFQTPRSQAIYDWRRALRFGDQAAADDALARMRELGVRPQDRSRSLRAMHPLGNLSIGANGGSNERAQFLRTLSPEERALLDEAVRWYQDDFLGEARRSVEAAP